MAPSPNTKLISAIDQLTAQLQSLQQFQAEQVQRAEQADSTSSASASLPLGAQIPGVTPIFAATSSAASIPAAFSSAMGTEGQAFSNLANQVAAGQSYRQQMMAQNAQVSQAQSGVSASASVPPGYSNSAGGGFSGWTAEQQGEYSAARMAAGGGAPSEEDQKMWELQLAGEGVPGPIGRVVRGSFGLNKSLGWAQTAMNSAAEGGSLPSFLGSAPTGKDSEGNLIGGSGAVGALNQGLQWAQNNPMKAYVGKEVLGQVMNIAGKASDMTQVGEQFGYNPTGATGDRTIMGFKNPVSAITSQAAQEGYAMEAEKMRLEGRMPGAGNYVNGLTSDQAQSLMGMVSGMGWQMNPMNPLKSSTPTGNAATIAEGMAPIMKQYPGLDPSVMEGFMQSLRNGGASVANVADQLKNLGTMSQATSQNMNQLGESILNTSQTFESMGSTSMGGIQAANAFQQITGLQGAPQMMSALAQNPMVQGMNLAQNGVLPSAMGDENPGVLSSTMRNTATMLMHAMKGVGQNRYQTIDGVRVKTQSGYQAQLDQVASMLGIPSAQLRQWVNPSAATGETNRANLQSVLGGQGGATGSATGLWSEVRNNQGHWNTKSLDKFHSQISDLTNHLQGTGISKSQIDAIQKQYGNSPVTEMDKLQSLLAKTENNKGNKVSADNKSQKQQVNVSISLTGQASKWFSAQSSQPTPAKNSANAGQGNYNATALQPGGDPGKNLSYFQAVQRAGRGLVPSG